MTDRETRAAYNLRGAAILAVEYLRKLSGDVWIAGGRPHLTVGAAGAAEQLQLAIDAQRVICPRCGERDVDGSKIMCRECWIDTGEPE